jgi:hypothetical protein
LDQLRTHFGAGKRLVRLRERYDRNSSDSGDDERSNKFHGVHLQRTGFAQTPVCASGDRIWIESGGFERTVQSTSGVDALEGMDVSGLCREKAEGEAFCIYTPCRYTAIQKIDLVRSVGANL